MKNKKYITLGFVSVGVALTLLFSSNLLAQAPIASEKKELSRLQSLAKFTKDSFFPTKSVSHPNTINAPAV